MVRQSRPTQVLLLVLLCAAAFLAAAPGHAQNRRVALVIGNGAYSSGGVVGRLENPTNDATDVARTLSALGVQLHGNRPWLNQTRQQMVRLIAEFAASLGPEDVAFVFFAGHGAQGLVTVGEQTWTENFLIPVDDQPLQHMEDLQHYAVSLGWLQSELMQRVQRAVVILDACRNVALLPRSRGAARGPTARGFVPPSISGVGFLQVVFATEANRTAADGAAGSRNSPFTAALLAELQADPDRRTEDLVPAIQQRVVRATNNQQRPTLYGTMSPPVSFSGRLGGGVFVRPQPAPQPQPDQQQQRPIETPNEIARHGAWTVWRRSGNLCEIFTRADVGSSSAGHSAAQALALRVTVRDANVGPIFWLDLGPSGQSSAFAGVQFLLLVVDRIGIVMSRQGQQFLPHPRSQLQHDLAVLRAIQGSSARVEFRTTENLFDGSGREVANSVFSASFNLTGFTAALSRAHEECGVSRTSHQVRMTRAANLRPPLTPGQDRERTPKAEVYFDFTGRAITPRGRDVVEDFNEKCDIR